MNKTRQMLFLGREKLNITPEAKEKFARIREKIKENNLNKSTAEKRQMLFDLKKRIRREE